MALMNRKEMEVTKAEKECRRADTRVERAPKQAEQENAAQASEAAKKPRRRTALTAEQRLGQAAEKSLRKVSAQLAEVLGEKAAKGDVASAKLLLQLAEKGKEAAERVDHAEDRATVDALIEQWSTEPEWTGQKFGEEYLPMCNEKGVNDAKKAGAYGLALLGSQAIDALGDARRDGADAGFNEVAGVLGEGGVDAA